MLGMYGHTWASQFGVQPEGTAAETWAASLAGLSGPQLAAGLQACVAEGSEWPPGAPRFRAMCLGIPSFVAVQYEVTRADAERSPFTRSVWQFIDGYAYRHASARECQKLLQAAYDRARDMVMRGVPLPEPIAGAIDHQPGESVPATAAQRQQHLANIAEILGLSPPEAEAIGEEGLLKAAGEGA